MAKLYESYKSNAIGARSTSTVPQLNFFGSKAGMLASGYWVT